MGPISTDARKFNRHHRESNPGTLRSEASALIFVLVFVRFEFVQCWCYSLRWCGVSFFVSVLVYDRVSVCAGIYLSGY